MIVDSIEPWVGEWMWLGDATVDLGCVGKCQGSSGARGRLVRELVVCAVAVFSEATTRRWTRTRGGVSGVT